MKKKITSFLILFVFTISTIQIFVKNTNALTIIDCNHFLRSQYSVSIKNLSSNNFRNNLDSSDAMLDAEKQRQKDEKYKLAIMTKEYKKFLNDKDKISYSYFDAQKFIEDYPDSPYLSEIQDYLNQFEIQTFDSEETFKFVNGYLGPVNSIYFYEMYCFSDVTLGNMTIKSGISIPFDAYEGQFYEFNGRFKIKNIEFDGIFVFKSDKFTAGVGSQNIH